MWTIYSLRNFPTPGIIIIALFIHRCSTSSTGAISFELSYRFYNPGPDFLGVGLAPIPGMYYVLTFLYCAGNALWFLQMSRNLQHYHHIHLWMSMLGVNKFLSVLFESISITYLKQSGLEVGWAVMYYIFTFTASIGFFLTVILIGNGFTILKVVLFIIPYHISSTLTH